MISFKIIPMSRTIHLITLFIGILFLQACANRSPDSLLDTSLSQQQVAHGLQQQHKNWKGVKYRMGGMSKKGIDCSGFVYRTFKDKMRVILPRTTALQSQVGYEINQHELKPGDLVFFKTGLIFKDNHVGVYMGKNRFLHASTSRGVMISKLNNPYWKDAYWHSRRVIR